MNYRITIFTIICLLFLSMATSADPITLTLGKVVSDTYTYKQFAPEEKKITFTFSSNTNKAVSLQIYSVTTELNFKLVSNNVEELNSENTRSVNFKSPLDGNNLEFSVTVTYKDPTPKDFKVVETNFDIVLIAQDSLIEYGLNKIYTNQYFDTENTFKVKFNYDIDYKICNVFLRFSSNIENISYTQSDKEIKITEFPNYPFFQLDLKRAEGEVSLINLVKKGVKDSEPIEVQTMIQCSNDDKNNTFELKNLSSSFSMLAKKVYKNFIYRFTTKEIGNDYLLFIQKAKLIFSAGLNNLKVTAFLVTEDDLKSEVKIPDKVFPFDPELKSFSFSPNKTLDNKTVLFFAVEADLLVEVVCNILISERIERLTSFSASNIVSLNLTNDRNKIYIYENLDEILNISSAVTFARVSLSDEKVYVSFVYTQEEPEFFNSYKDLAFDAVVNMSSGYIHQYNYNLDKLLRTFYSELDLTDSRKKVYIIIRYEPENAYDPKSITNYQIQFQSLKDDKIFDYPGARNFSYEIAKDTTSWGIWTY